ncbi:uncharacterized protein [Triticum aestivum]|uniref:uncharacterized protein isoform X1 n=1 Tax=Triticum aestivum TaxID=4565 RepID=UPI001D033B9C|nr:uncharacterized protein LOC123087580 isoform X1 [Triticum aestivum]XP_044365555.1 uncharacterized protein LOC123087580 isoform X1 [Triticum aestivum]XP_044365556.1 uncharacterized protein LOC123087580 isoform X1 [Triticum aestivum]XP_044365557.1 uncharacterized protein LOC123087580 isoform X1 [Triticum aestivum]
MQSKTCSVFSVFWKGVLCVFAQRSHNFHVVSTNVLPKQRSACQVGFLQYGFSHTVVEILQSLDVLTNEVLHQELKEYSSWPTFPQHYVDGEFFCGTTSRSGLLNSPCPRTQPKLLGLASALSYLEVLVSFRDRRLRCYGSAPTTYQMIMMLMLSEVLDQLCYVLISNTNHCLVHEPKCAAAPYTYRIGYGVSQNTDSKMCSAFLINAATVSRWSAMTSCQSSAQRFWSATRSVASPTWWCRFCGRSMCPSKRSMCSPTRRSSSGSMSTQAGSPPRSSTSTSSSSKGVTSQLVCIYEDCSLVSAFPCPTIMAQNFETICCSTRTW